MEWANTAISWWTTGLMGLLLYWLPMVGCLILYSIRSGKQYQKDKTYREEDHANNKGEYCYSPTLTIGTLIGRFVVSFIPVANLIALAVDLAPGALRTFFKWVEKTFDIPLVPKYKIEKKIMEKSDD